MPIITISRGTMSGGKEVAECLANLLGVPCVAREVLLDAAAKLGVHEDELSRGIERTPGLLDRFTAKSRLYLFAAQAALAEHARTGNLVYHGLAGHLLLREIPEVLRVRLIAPLEKRVQALMDRRGIAREEAERAIAEVDEQRARWTREMYAADIEDPRLYDVVLNLDKTSESSACDVLVAMSEQPQFSSPDLSRLADFTVVSRVRLALALHPATRGLDLAVGSRNGVVAVSGEIPKTDMITHASQRGLAELRAVVAGVPGVRSVVLDVTVVSAYA